MFPMSMPKDHQDPLALVGVRCWSRHETDLREKPFYCEKMAFHHGLCLAHEATAEAPRVRWSSADVDPRDAPEGYRTAGLRLVDLAGRVMLAAHVVGEREDERLVLWLSYRAALLRDHGPEHRWPAAAAILEASMRPRRPRASQEMTPGEEAARVAWAILDAVRARPKPHVHGDGRGAGRKGVPLGPYTSRDGIDPDSPAGRFAALRRELCLTQAEAATRLGIARTSVSAIEHGHRSVTEDEFNLLRGSHA